MHPHSAAAVRPPTLDSYPARCQLALTAPGLLLLATDDALKKLFPGTKTTMFKLQKLLSRHCKTAGGQGAGSRAGHRVKSWEPAA